MAASSYSLTGLPSSFNESACGLHTEHHLDCPLIDDWLLCTDALQDTCIKDKK